MANGAGDLWGLMTVVGVVTLGIVIAYAMIRNRRMTPQEKGISERATDRVYDQEARDPANRNA